MNNSDEVAGRVPPTAKVASPGEASIGEPSPRTRWESAGLDNWGTELVERVLYPFAIFVTPLFILSLIVFFVADDFRNSLNDGVRSFAAVLLPLMVLTFLVTFRRDDLSKAGRAPNVLTFSLMLIAGVIVMAVLSFSSSIPLAELLLSGTFAVLVFSYVALPKDKMVSYYFGVILGFLLFVVVNGFPNL